MESNIKLKFYLFIYLLIYLFIFIYLFYVDDIIKTEDSDFDIILINERSYEDILVFSISCKTLIDAKPLCTRFDKVNGFIRVYNGTTIIFIIF